MKALACFLFTIVCCSTVAQTRENQVTYQSEVDQLVTLKKVSVLPFVDNVQGIYARPLQQYLIEQVQGSHRWDYLEANLVGAIPTPDDLEEDPKKLADLCGSIPADGFISTRISRGPNGVTIIMDLFLTKDKKLFAKADIRDFKSTDVASVKDQLGKAFHQLLNKIPYSGIVLSRQGQRVTVNLGALDGVKKDQILAIIQVIALNRHPKFNFLINSEKEILGRIKILKVDETLSFAMIVTERERGAIQKDAKVGPLEFVKYAEPESLSLEPSGMDALKEKPESDVIYGKDASAWVPQKPPSYGQVGARFGLGTMALNSKLNAEGSLDTNASIYPSVFLEGELWLTPEFSVHATMREGILSVGNPLAGSSPGKLSVNQSAYELLFGYNLRFNSDIWGPKVEGLLGYSLYKLYVDDSTPTAYTTLQYTGVKFGIDGSTPVTGDREWGVGGQLFFIFSPSLSEKPVTSGSSSSTTMNQFAVYGYKKLGEHLKALVRMDFELYSTSFSGTGSRADSATSTSEKITTLSAGIDYLF